jgi:hypothetical protein
MGQQGPESLTRAKRSLPARAGAGLPGRLGMTVECQTAFEVTAATVRLPVVETWAIARRGLQGLWRRIMSTVRSLWPPEEAWECSVGVLGVGKTEGRGGEPPGTRRRGLPIG